MKLKNKAIFLLVFLLFVISVTITITFTIASNGELINFDQNILENMKDGLKNDKIQLLYKQDIILKMCVNLLIQRL